MQKSYFLPFILTFILVNSELRNFSSDRVTANSLIFSKLHGHWSLVTCTFTLSLMYSIRFYAEKIGGYENKLQICNAINEIFSHLKLMSPICEDRRHFFVSSVGAFSFLQLAAPQHCKSKNCIFSLLFAHLALTLQCKRRSTVKKGCYVSTPLVCTTGKNQFEAADKCVQSLIFCARTSGMPYTLHDAGFSSCTLARPFDIRTTSDAVLNTKRNPRVQRLKLKKFQNNIINITFKEL